MSYGAARFPVQHRPRRQFTEQATKSFLAQLDNKPSIQLQQWPEWRQREAQILTATTLKRDG
jgi:hypothetical protein